VSWLFWFLVALSPSLLLLAMCGSAALIDLLKPSHRAMRLLAKLEGLWALPARQPEHERKRQA
jgi:hypothetical protein